MKQSVPWATIWAVIGSAGLVALMGFASDLFLLGFLSILGVIFLRTLSGWLQMVLPLSDGAALSIVLVLLLSLYVVAGFIFAPAISEQVDELSKSLPVAWGTLRARLESFPRIQVLFAQVSHVEEWLSPSQISKATGVLTATFGTLASLAVMTVISLYIAFAPRTYIDGLLQLVHPRSRAKADTLLLELGETLKWWLVGKSISMFTIGLMTTVGLWLLGVPLALILGILAGLLAFIPNIGPILSALPAVLLALANDPHQALYVVALYVGVQLVESNLLAPYIERRTVLLPPAVVIFSQLLLGLLFGFLGVLLATPLTAVTLVVVRRLYTEPLDAQPLSALAEV